MTDSASLPAAGRPDSRVMAGVIPYLSLAGRTGEAAGFYARAFGARDLGGFPDADRPGQYLHLQLEINGGALMMTDQQCPTNPSRVGLKGGHLQLVVDDGAGWWRRAVDAGCTVIAPYERQFWGDDWGLLQDPFGQHWAILQPGPAGAGREQETQA